MPARRKKRKEDSIQNTSSFANVDAENLRLLTRLFALLVVKGETQPDKIKLLSGAGFSNTEIAELLGISANSVNVALHRQRAGK